MRNSATTSKINTLKTIMMKNKHYFLRKMLAVVFGMQLCFFMACKQTSTKHEGYTIYGRVNGINDGFVKMYYSDSENVSDSAVIIYGQFFMQGKIGLPERRIFNIMPGNYLFPAFVEDGVTNIFVDTTGAQFQGPNKDLAWIWEIEQTGSNMADVYTRFKDETNFKKGVSLINTLEKELKANAGKNEKIEAIKIKEIDSLNTVMLSAQKHWIENYISQYPASVAGIFLFNEFYQQFPDLPVSYLESILDRFTGIAKDSKYYLEMNNTVATLKGLQENSPAPDFTLLNSDKIPFTFSATNGKYRLIDFWASWCVPCRKAIPKWKKLYEKYKEKDFVIVSMSTDRNREDWIKALKEEQMPWIQVIDNIPPNKISDLFAVNYLPYYVLVDKQGAIILATGDEEQMIKKIEEILSN
jgi:thiol-disulfide isomerase/thioredoxin